MLIQSVSGVPGEDQMHLEKSATLCSMCDINTKYLFTLPHSEPHLLGYTVRLENAFSEIAGGFYLGEVRNINY